MRWIAAWLAWVAVAAAAAPAHSQTAGQCRRVEVQFTPTSDLQIVVWIEDREGTYIDTAFITEATGTYGLGNRPGMMEFNTAYRWPYGRRITTFPVWAHRHGFDWPLLVFQNWEQGLPLSYNVGDSPETTPEENLSHVVVQSSEEVYYCKPLQESDPGFDTNTCASPVGVFTDKGKYHPSERSQYPPRSDLDGGDSTDSDDVPGLAISNPFDRVSFATPAGDEPYFLSWALPQDLPDGDYVAWIEVSKEKDQNEFYDKVPYEEADIMWGQYGVPYLGQPSVVYSVPFSVSAEPLSTTSTSDYAGYGDPDGVDGDLRDPDMTINSAVPGSGAARLALISDSSGMYRVRVLSRNEQDLVPPGPLDGLAVIERSSSHVELTFGASGDDGLEGSAYDYEVRYLIGEPVTDENYQRATAATVDGVESIPAGVQLDISVSGLIPQTNYHFGVRALDECLNPGPISSIDATTTEALGGRVDACFIATAAYGSALAADVSMLRDFRDKVLRRSVVGELAIATYYTFGPSMAAVISPSQLLRSMVRALLEPVVGLTRTTLNGLAAKQLL